MNVTLFPAGYPAGNGGRIVAEEWGDNYLIYLYDESGSPVGMCYRKSSDFETAFTRYFFEKDLFGNIVAIYNEAGTKVANYCYDAWGNCTVLANTNGIGTMNPFRYRGYYLDTETNLYYLQSRYYDSYVGRFINADDVSTVTASMDALTDKNLFSYCDNNPVMRTDEDGEFWNIIIGAAVGAVAGAVVTAITQLIENPEAYKSGEFWAQVGVSALTGAVSGAIAATGIGVAGQVAVNAGLGVASSIANTAIDSNGSASLGTYITNAIVDGAAGALGGLMGGPGTGNKHLSASFGRALKNGNWSYYYSQVAKESFQCGTRAISGILRSNVPSLVKSLFPTFIERIKGVSV